MWPAHENGKDGAEKSKKKKTLPSHTGLYGVSAMSKM
jgi:hypothetical protein